MRYWIQPLDSVPLYQHAMEAFESFICRNGSSTIGIANTRSFRSIPNFDIDPILGYKEGLMPAARGKKGTTDNCDLVLAAENSFLKTAATDNPTIRNLYQASKIFASSVGEQLFIGGYEL